MTRTCQHLNCSRHMERAYVAPIADAVGPDPHARGGRTYVEVCSRCWSCRSVNQNGRHREVGEWLPAPVVADAQQ